MAKRIIICCDGTWNSPGSSDDASITNVIKILRAIEPRDAATNTEQVVYYHRGLGTGTNKIGKLIEGATGKGIKRNIESCYRFLANNYVEGDQIYMFGFSRGAFTARSLCGLLSCIGLLTKEQLDLFPRAYKHYRTPLKKRTDGDWVNKLNLDRPHIHFLGVWDTVGALGAPTPILGAITRKLWVGFNDATISDEIGYAYQAMAIDEKRKIFAPAMWTKQGKQHDVKQVWFAGVHSNVGGGYPKNMGLSDEALMWLVNRSTACGLVFNQAYLNDTKKIKPNAKGKLHDSFSWPYKLMQLFKPFHRPMGQANYRGEMLDESVLRRLSDSSMNYQPVNLLKGKTFSNALIKHEKGREVFANGALAIPIYRERRLLRMMFADEDAQFTVDGMPPIQGALTDYTGRGGCKLKTEQSLSSLSNGTEGQLYSELTGYKKAVVAWCSDNDLGLRFHQERKPPRKPGSNESAQFIVNGSSLIQGALIDYTDAGGCKLATDQSLSSLPNDSEGEFYSKTIGRKRAVIAWCSDNNIGLRFIAAA